MKRRKSFNKYADPDYRKGESKSNVAVASTNKSVSKALLNALALGMVVGADSPYMQLCNTED